MAFYFAVRNTRICCVQASKVCLPGRAPTSGSVVMPGISLTTFELAQIVIPVAYIPVRYQTPLRLNTWLITNTTPETSLINPTCHIEGVPGLPHQCDGFCTLVA